MLPQPSQTETDGGRRRGEGEASKTKLIADLAARGVLRHINEHLACPTCNLPMTHEASYRCTRCDNMYHVRCLATLPTTSRHPATKWRNICFLCSLANPVPEKNPPLATQDQAKTATQAGQAPLAQESQPDKLTQGEETGERSQADRPPPTERPRKASSGPSEVIDVMGVCDVSVL